MVARPVMTLLRTIASVILRWSQLVLKLDRSIGAIPRIYRANYLRARTVMRSKAKSAMLTKLGTVVDLDNAPH